MEAVLRASMSVLEGFLLGVWDREKSYFALRRYAILKIDSRYDSNIFEF
jgi:hypothetical protein